MSREGSAHAREGGRFMSGEGGQLSVRMLDSRQPLPTDFRRANPDETDCILTKGRGQCGWAA
jgi:hypothetical protein